MFGNMFFKLWYEEDVKPNLTLKDKQEILKQISDISLKQPIHIQGISVKHSEVPKLAKFSNTKDFTGLQLYIVMTEIFKEVHGK